MAWDIAQRATGFGPVGYSRQADEVMEMIRARAHALWEQAGRPEGHEPDFWSQAQTEVMEAISLR
ncbi:MAG: DUF2934 domain-containing protein [Magnetospirillum sp.]|nr:DUF2934 domain-containing protein [Magnetospirillum sp.]